MKVCLKCKEEKPLTEYYKQIQKGKKDQKWDYFDCYCKDCRKLSSYIRRNAIKIQAIEYLGGCCVDCKLVDDPCVYDFHHIDPTKKEISFGSAKGRSFNSIKEELDKCILLCSNCHRKRHSNKIF